MQELSSSLSMTGLIATIISLLFAAAAFYISHKSQTPSPPKAQPHATTPRHVPTPAPQLFSPGIPKESSTSSAAQSMPLSGSPVFRKLGAQGLENPIADAKGENPDNRYLWK